MPATLSESILEKLNRIAEDPFAPLPNVTKLVNRDGFRLRIGDWRIIYEIHQDEITIEVVQIGQRKEVYR